MSRKSKIFKICGIVVLSLLGLLSILFFVLNWVIVSGMASDARICYDETKSQLIVSIDSFINVNNRLPVTLSEVGLSQNALSYDIDGVYYVTLVTDDSVDNSYFLKFGYRGDYEDADYYVSRTRQWHNKNTMPVTFVENDTMRRIAEIKSWLTSDVDRVLDSIAPNTSISFDYPYCSKDSIVFLNRYTSNGMSMKGWAVSDRYFILFYEFGDWVYQDADGNVYHKFWNYRANDSLIYRPDPMPRFLN